MQQLDQQIYVQEEIEIWRQAGCEAVLLDAATPGEFGGTGKSLDWSAVATLQSSLPIVLAGGLRAENVSEAIQRSQAPAVDVASGVEVRPGVKDPVKVRSFIRSARGRGSRFELNKSEKSSFLIPTTLIVTIFCPCRVSLLSPINKSVCMRSGKRPWHSYGAWQVSLVIVKSSIRFKAHRAA